MGNNLYQQVKISCESSWTSEQDSDGNTLRNWQVTLVAVDDGKEVPGKLQAMLDHVEYILHPTFNNPRRDVKEEPYLLKEEGWGEFDLRIMLHFADEFAPREIIVFDLNFKEPQYSKTHVVTFSDVSAEVASYLESLKDIGKESTQQRAKKKLPSLQTYQNHQLHSHHQHNYNGYNRNNSEDDEELSLPASSPTSSLSPAPPALSPPSDHLTPQQDFNEISPLSEVQNLGGMMEDEIRQLNGVDNDVNEDHEDDIQVEDEVLAENDIQHLNRIHYLNHDSRTCEEWNIPERFNMVELARRFSLLSESQADVLYTVIRKYQTSDMSIEHRDGEVALDLYSLGTPLLNQLWSLTEVMFGDNSDNE